MVGKELKKINCFNHFRGFPIYTESQDREPQQHKFGLLFLTNVDLRKAKLKNNLANFANTENQLSLQAAAHQYQFSSKYCQIAESQLGERSCLAFLFMYLSFLSSCLYSHTTLLR